MALTRRIVNHTINGSLGKSYLLQLMIYWYSRVTVVTTGVKGGQCYVVLLLKNPLVFYMPTFRIDHSLTSSFHTIYKLFNSLVGN
jgi:hypothetical protein